MRWPSLPRRNAYNERTRVLKQIEPGFIRKVRATLIAR